MIYNSLKSVNKLWILLLVVILLGIALSSNFVNANGGHHGPVCPISSQNGRTIVEFDGEKIRAEFGEDEASTDSFNVFLPKGKYNITFTSFDNHSHHNQSDQTQEQWFLKLKNSSGDPFQETSSISDLPDNQNYLTEEVDTNFNITEDVHSVRAFHSAWWAPGNPHSVAPVCAAFDFIPPPPAPTCTLDADPESIDEGDSSELIWTTTNADSVNIDKGIGSVNLDGSKSVSPSDTTTYTLTATGAGGSVTCKADVTVSIPPPPSPICTLEADPTNITKGEFSDLSWTTTNATEASISDGSQSEDVSPVETGSASVSPEETTTYIMTATGPGGVTTCEALVTVVEEPKPRSCELNLSSNSIELGESSTLSWDTENILSASIDNGIGSVSLPDGSVEVSPTEDTEYVMNALDIFNDPVVCKAEITVTSPPPQDPPSCTLEADPSVVSSGGATTLIWTTSDANSAEINQGIGSVSPVAGGSIGASGVTNGITYTMTVTGPGGTAMCEASVSVSATPLADVSIAKDADPGSVEKGNMTVFTLTYSNNGNLDAEDVFIEDIGTPAGVLNNYTVLTGPDHGTCTANSDGISCDIGTLAQGENGTITYKATGVEVGIVDNTATITTSTNETNLANNEDSERVSVFVPQDPPCTVNCGGGTNPPRVVLFSKPGDEEPFASQSFIYLSQIPYTGVSMDIKGLSFIALLLLLSAGISYFILRKWNKNKLAAVNGVKDDPRNSEDYTEDKALSISQIIEDRDYEHTLHLSERKSLEPTAERAVSSGGESFREDNSKVSNGKNEERPVQEKKESAPGSEIEKVLTDHARERGALVSEDAISLLGVASAVSQDKDKTEVLDSIISSAQVMYPREDGWLIIDKNRFEIVLFSPSFNVVGIFANWLSEGDSKKVFAFLRILRHHKVSVKSFLKQVAYFIDHLYRCRIGESLDSGYQGIDLENQCTNWSTNNIEKIVSILVNGIDESYSSEEASVKLALVKVLEISRKSEAGGSYYK